MSQSQSQKSSQGVPVAVPQHEPALESEGFHPGASTISPDEVNSHYCFLFKLKLQSFVLTLLLDVAFPVIPRHRRFEGSTGHRRQEQSSSAGSWVKQHLPTDREVHASPSNW